MILTSPRLNALPGLGHGFSTRLGGVSEGDFRTLNLARTVGDRPEAVEANRARFLALLGAPPGALTEVNQVHGSRVVLAESTGVLPEEADAIVTQRPGVAVAVRTADCAPILIVAMGSRPEAVAAVHAGWRGAVSGVTRRAVERLVELGARPERMVAAIGPTIGVGAFEVGPEVVEAAERARPDPPVQIGPNGKPQLDLVRLVELELLDCGVGSIDRVGGCTFDNRAMFFSHRRDRGRTGRMLSAIFFK